MRQYFELYPKVVLMDFTYQLNYRRMSLFLLLVVDGNGESQTAALFIIKSENYNIISKILARIKNYNSNHAQIKEILSDKNFAGRRSYSDAFENAQLLASSEICARKNGN